MNKKSQAFSIKDLENICGVKAHTIRIWEKRYGLLTPNRSNTNIRNYNMESLQKLLNVSFLVSCGYKISRISKLNPQEINEYVASIVSDKTTIDRSLNSLKLSMLNYNVNLFNETFEKLKEKFTFRDIFYDMFIPFLNEIGMLWQSNTINSSHEHFITNLIKQKLSINIDKLQQAKSSKNKTFVLFLPAGETHDLSLMFINFLLLLKGYKTIFLAGNITIDYIEPLSKLQSNLTFISYLTLMPSTNLITEYVSDFTEKICDSNNNHNFWIMGRQLNEVVIPKKPSLTVISSFKDLEKLID